jgi:H+-transporting ATPase
VKVSAILKFLSYFTGSIAYLIEITLILSGALEDWTDFGIIAGLLVINALIGFLEEAKAENAVEALRKNLALKSKAIRDSKINEIEARELVPGDIVILRIGDIIPADCRLLGITSSGEETNSDLSIDQSALTGESLPVSRKKGDTVFSSSVVKQGQMLGVVTHSGERTFIGKAAKLMSITKESGHFQQVIQKIGNFLIIITVVMVVILLVCRHPVNVFDMMLTLHMINP